MTPPRRTGDWVRHYSSHGALLRPAARGNGTLDAIVVPAARPADNLESAVRLGAELGVPVVLLCSGRALPQYARQVAEGVEGARCSVVDLSHRAEVGLPALDTAAFGQAIVGSHGDLSLKRNLGLVLGRMCGWRTVLFLDDDIRGVSPALTRLVVGSLEHHAVAGMPATSYPDNSVVCHARRLAGGGQGVFVSGSALAVDVRRAGAFFPEVYNEDWFFLAPHLESRAVATLGSVRQEPYEPFSDPHRAGSEEFGDVLAEGLVGLLHSGPSAPAGVSTDYWAAFLRCRRDFIRDAVEGCRARAAGGADDEAGRALRALEKAEWSRSRLSPGLLADWVGAWRRDLTTWQGYLSGIPTGKDLPAALELLGLPVEFVGSHPAREPGQT